MIPKPEKKMRKVLSEVVKPKKVRKSLPLSVKLGVIKQIEAGQRNKDICLAMHLSALTVRTIFVNKEKIRTAESVCGTKLRNVSEARHPSCEKLERLLTHLIDSYNERSAAQSFMIIQPKALSLFEDLKKKAIKEVDKSAKRIGIKGE
jgi:citrate lyase synthetase